MPLLQQITFPRWRFRCAFILAAAACAIGTITPPTHAGDDPPTPMNFIYGPHFRNSVWLYLPDSATEPTPVILYIHGGGWVAGSKAQVEPHVQPLLDLGFAVASMNYRFSNHATYPAQTHDAKAVVRWLRGNAATHNLDPTRIGVLGNSAGANMAGLLGTTAGDAILEGTVGSHLTESSDVQAVATVAAPIDIFLMGEFNPSPTSEFSLVIGTSIAEINDNIDNPDYADEVALVESMSPNYQATGDDAPHYILHGDADTQVPVSQAQLYFDALDQASVDTTLDILNGAPHEVPNAEYDILYAFFANQFYGPVAGDVDGNRLVNIDDLLNVINAFGNDCTADPCDEDVNDSGMVNIDDVLHVILNWTMN